MQWWLEVAQERHWLRLEGLKDSPRSGKPPTITPDQRVNVIRLACEKPSDGSNAWTVRRLAKRLGLGSTTVHRILNEGVIKPHKVDHWCGKSPDPEFEEKQATIIGLYMAPPENALVLTVIEKSHIQALDRSQPELPLRPCNPKRHTTTYKRHGTTCPVGGSGGSRWKSRSQVCRETHTQGVPGFFKKSVSQ